MRTLLRSILCFCLVSCAADPETVDLELTMERQQAGNWCWAAVAQSFAVWWRNKPMTQSEVVTYTFGRECTPQTCDGQNSINKMIDHVGLHPVMERNDPFPDEDYIKHRIASINPGVILYNNPNVGNHLVVIGGYDPTGFWLYNPARKTTMPVDAYDVVPYEKLNTYLGPSAHVALIMFVEEK